MEQYLYNLGYCSHDDSYYVQMWHKDKMSRKKLREKVQGATIKALEYAIKHSDDFVFFEDGIMFEALFDHVVSELKKLGFKPVKFTAELDAYGLARVGGANVDDDFCGLFEKELYKLVPKGLHAQSIEIGQEYWQEKVS